MPRRTDRRHRPTREPKRWARCSIDIRKELDAAMLIIEHDMPLIMSMSDRVYCLELGRVISEGDPSTSATTPRSSPATSAWTNAPSTAATARCRTKAPSDDFRRTPRRRCHSPPYSNHANSATHRRCEQSDRPADEAALHLGRQVAAVELGEHTEFIADLVPEPDRVGSARMLIGLDAQDDRAVRGAAPLRGSSEGCPAGAARRCSFRRRRPRSERCRP